MALPFFENGLSNGIIQTPNDYFRDQQQAAIDQQWDCTSAKYTIKQQADFGSDVYNDIEVWIDYVVGLGSRGTTNGDDFRQLIFRDINYQVKRGLYYQFDGNTWIVYFSDEYSSLSKDAGVRRCNNVMRIVDPENGSIFSIPCVIDYDMTSPSQQVSSYIITPNNHATVMVQGNADTLRLFKLNTRYMFNGRPFKLLAYQNALDYSLTYQSPTLLYLDLYLDEIHNQDDIENGLAYNGDYKYSIQIDSNDMELTNGSTGTLNTTILLNGEEVIRNVVWSASDPTVVNIDNNGNYQVIGDVGTQTIIQAMLENNTSIFSQIIIKVVDTESIQPNILIVPSFDKIRQYESIAFNIEVMYGSNLINELTNVQISLSPDSILLSNQYLTITQEESQYVISANSISPTPQILYITVQNTTPSFQVTEQFTLNVVSMFG